MDYSGGADGKLPHRLRQQRRLPAARRPEVTRIGGDRCGHRDAPQEAPAASQPEQSSETPEESSVPEEPICTGDGGEL